jgi:FkbM family methyltransferase
MKRSVFLNRYRLRSIVTRRRNTRWVRLASAVAEKLIRTVRNHTNFGMAWNGEQAALAMIYARFPGPILDVGAHKGHWTQMALSLAPRETIHCFELSPDNLPLLTMTVGHFPNVVINRCGLGRDAREVTVYHNVDGGNLTSYVRLPYTVELKQLPGRLIRGDDYVQAQRFSEISYIKIDVEGAEMDVLAGLADTVGRGIVHAVQFEHGTMHVMTRHFLRDFLDFFASRDYVVCRMWPDGIEPIFYNFERDEEFVGQNFVAVRRASLSNLAAAQDPGSAIRVLGPLPPRVAAAPMAPLDLG